MEKSVTLNAYALLISMEESVEVQFSVWIFNPISGEAALEICKRNKNSVFVYLIGRSGENERWME